MTGREIAIKRLRLDTDPERVRREIGALRLLDDPGVVRLLDHGEDEHGHWLAMDLVAGTPFPGPLPAPHDWKVVKPLLRRLLEVLGRVHALGIVHRDLKPANVLVRDDGLPVLLDLGLARGGPLATCTSPGEVLGTPRYLAPEQLTGEPVDARTDLYAVGVMVFELLTGAPPFPENGPLEEWLWRRVGSIAPSLGRVAPAAGEEAAALVDALLSTRPLARPPSAAHALALLDGPESYELPLVGRARPVAEAIAAIARGEAVWIVGEPRSGRTRLLRTVLAERQATWLLPGHRPLESLAGIGGTRADLKRQIDAGPVVADPLEALDAHTRRLLGALAAQPRPHAIMCTCAAAPAFPGVRISIGALEPDAIAELFALPERIFHLRSDASRALWSRTGGEPAAVANELMRWERAGLAQRDAGGRWTLSREDLDRLDLVLRFEPDAAPVVPDLAEALSWVVLAGPDARVDVVAKARGCERWEVEADFDALNENGLVRRLSAEQVEALRAPPLDGATRTARHAALARALAPGDARIRHLLAAGAVHEAGPAAVARAAELIAEGRLLKALALLELLLDIDPGLHEGWALAADAALSEGGRQALMSLAIRAARTKAAPRVVHDLLEAGAAAQQGDIDRVRVLLAPLPPFERAELDAWRRSLPMLASLRHGDLPRAARLLRQLDAPADRRMAWMGHLRYAQGRFATAARLHGRVASMTTSPHRALHARLNEAAAWLDALSLARAARAASAARAAAERLRLPYLEAFGSVLERVARVRMGGNAPIDLELVELVASMGDTPLLPLTCLTEAVAALRCREEGPDPESARTLADRAERAWTTLGRPAFAALAGALRSRLDGQPAPELLRAAERAPPRVAAQVAALLGAPREDWIEAAGRTMPPELRTVRLEVLALDECRLDTGPPW